MTDKESSSRSPPPALYNANDQPADPASRHGAGQAGSPIAALDSALISALRDKRERIGLLKLEQVLVLNNHLTLKKY